MSNTDLNELLKYIDPSTLSYQEWVNVGMALKEEGYTMEDWQRWSSQDTGRYNPTDFEEKWDSFRRHDVSGGTIVAMAKERGWSPEKKLNVYMTGTDKYNVTFSWDENDTAPEEPFEPQHWKPTNDLIRYLEAVFDPSDIIGYTMKSRAVKGKYIPNGKGTYIYRAGELIDQLRIGEPIEQVFGSYDEMAGAWIRINPLDGKGVDDANVIEYKNLLIECDTGMSPKEQAEAFEKIRLPIRAMVYSGGKSVHAIVKVDASSLAEYRLRFNFIKNIMHDAGMEIDYNNKNPSRLSRLPGVVRNGHKQFLLKTDIGMDSFEEWQEWVAAKNDGMPEIINLGDVWDSMPPLKPELIEGILRQSHKMIIASTSKAGKTFILIELAVAIAEGMTWIGHRCNQGKVLYINMELDGASFLHRVKDIYGKLGMNHDNHVRNIEIWNLRGVGKTLSELAPIIINRMRDNGYLAVMIDPLYKVMEGDENSNGDVARMVSSFDKIAEETGAAVIYAHHFAKGSAANKSIIDRAAGAGTFARDPDAILTMTQVDWAPKIEKEKDWTAWRVESTLREFKAIKPVDMFFDWPIHKVDYDGRLADCDLLSTENNKRSQKDLDIQKDVIEALVNECNQYQIGDYTCFKTSELEEINNNSPKPLTRGTLNDRVKEAGYVNVKRGFWGKIIESDDCLPKP